jgi:hypothetical protein
MSPVCPKTDSLHWTLAQVEIVGAHATQLNIWKKFQTRILQGKFPSNPEMLARELILNLEVLCLWLNSFA